MEKYWQLLSKVAERVAQKVAQEDAIAVDLERLERVLSAAECTLATADKAG